MIGYDVFEMLTNFWDVLINRRDEFVSELKKFEINETEFTRNRHILLAYWDKVKPATLVYKTKQKMDLSSEEMTRLDGDKLMQAVYYYYNMTLSYGPMFLGWPSSNEIKKEKFDRRIEKLSGLQLTGLKVSCCDFKTAILNHPDDFLFLDPPYYLGQDSKMFKGMYPNCNFAIHHNAFEHDVLCELLKNHKGGSCSRTITARRFGRCMRGSSRRFRSGSTLTGKVKHELARIVPIRISRRVTRYLLFVILHFNTFNNFVRKV